MALDRTTTTVRLKSDDGLFYTVALVDYGNGIFIPEADETTGDSGTSDEYVAIIGDDDQVYRWSLETSSVDGAPFVGDHVELSPDQEESAADGLDLLLGSTWYRVKIKIQSDAFGSLTPTIVVGTGEPWTPASLIHLDGPFDFIIVSDVFDLSITPDVFDLKI